MALQITLASDFQSSAINFSSLRKNKMGGKAVYLSKNGKDKIFLQLPYMRSPFGLSSYTDESSKRTSYSLDLSLDENVGEVENLFNSIDELILKTVHENSVEWLGKQYNIDVMREALYKPLVRPGKGDYPGTIKLKVMTDMRTGDFIPEAYDSTRNLVPLDSIEKGQRVMVIIDLSQLWFIDNKFGVSVRLQQCLLAPSKKLPSFAFQGVEPPPEEEEEDIDVDDLN